VTIKKFSPVFILALILAVPCSAQDKLGKKKEVRLFVGLNLSRAQGSSGYHDTWKEELLSNVYEQTRISSCSKNNIYLSAFFSFFVKPNFGFQAGLGYMKNAIPNEASFDFSWTDGSIHNEHRDWKGRGELRLIPFDLNAAGRWKKNNIFLFVSGGVSFFFNKFESVSYAGFGVQEVYKIWTTVPPNIISITTQRIDALQAQLEIQEKWVSLGINLGAGLDFKLSPKFTLTVEIRYYFCPKRKFYWKWKTGLYDGILPLATFGNIYQGGIKDWEFNEQQADYAEQLTTPLTLNPSSLQVGLGLKFSLGSSQVD